jgi:DNA mismatch repair protein MutS
VVSDAPLAVTPMMRQYQELKQRYPDFLLLFRLGDFYEMFFADAERGARLLQIALTSRQGAPMAGIPHHAAEGYIARLVKAGQKIAVCEQLEAPGKGKKLLRRDVVRVITPGTITDTAYLPGAANNFLMALVPVGDGGRRRGLGLALLDVSTGDFWVGEESEPDEGLLGTGLLRRPAEILFPDAMREAYPELLGRLQNVATTLTFYGAAPPTLHQARDDLRTQFGAPAVEALGLARMTAGLQAASIALQYVRATQGASSLAHLTTPQRLVPADALALDETAVRTLELLEGADGSVRSSLLGVLDATVTPMGARLLRQWLLRPLRSPDAIATRQEAVAALIDDPGARATLRRSLGAIGDLERCTSRASLGTAHARDLVALRASLGLLPNVREAASRRTAAMLAEAAAQIAPLEPLREVLVAALVDEPPLLLHDGGMIRQSWSEALRAIAEEAREAREWIAGLEGRERTRTGIAGLRVRFNRVFGYGIEVTRSQAGRVPAEYVRRQTLTTGERYITEELKSHETTVLGADERRRRLEYELFDEVRRRVASQAPALQATARAVALLDVCAALAEVAHLRGHTRPTVDDSDALFVVDGRHPVLEARGEAPVTPNDAALDADTRIMILTGPNMAGKSVYLRQTGHIVLMAQIGAFVPAREARIGTLDRLFTRVGAQDNLARGQSTFLVEMVETAAILHSVTPRSLVLLDEVGRGTSTYDGLAIAWAVVEALHDRAPGAKVLCATHFHELTRLADRLPGVRNFHVAVREWHDEIIFLHKVRPGSTDRSYGVQVARLAGLPPAVIARARALLAEFEREREGRLEARDTKQLGLFAPVEHPLLAELAGLELAHVTPIEALNLLAKWQERFRSGG